MPNSLKLILTVFVYGLLVATLVGGMLYYIFPQWMPHWFGSLVAFFIIVEMLIVYWIDAKSKKTTHKQLINSYMLSKVLKIIVSLIFVTIYALVIKEGLKSFVLIFMSFYLLFLFVETAIFLKIERQLKKNNKE